MKTNSQVLDLGVDLEKKQYNWREDIIINKSKLLEKIEETEKLSNLINLKQNISFIKSVINCPKSDREGLVNIDQNGDTIVLKKGALLEELKQIEDAYTAERAKYYLERLKKGISEGICLLN